VTQTQQVTLPYDEGGFGHESGRMRGRRRRCRWWVEDVPFVLVFGGVVEDAHIFFFEEKRGVRRLDLFAAARTRVIGMHLESSYQAYTQLA
jgi:hypothetical protein